MYMYVYICCGGCIIHGIVQYITTVVTTRHMPCVFLKEYHGRWFFYIPAWVQELRMLLL